MERSLGLCEVVDLIWSGEYGKEMGSRSMHELDQACQVMKGMLVGV